MQLLCGHHINKIKKVRKDTKSSYKDGSQFVRSAIQEEKRKRGDAITVFREMLGLNFLINDVCGQLSNHPGNCLLFWLI